MASHRTDQQIALSQAELALLRAVAEDDTGSGVPFEYVGRGRYRLTGSDYTANRRTFYALTDSGLLADNCGDHSAPVRITQAGRDRASGNGGTR